MKLPEVFQTRETKQLVSAARICSASALAVTLLACQPVAPTSKTSETADDSSQWRFWFIDTSGRSAVETDTTDWSVGRVGGTQGTTLVAECNGQDPTAFVLSIEEASSGTSEYAPMAQSYMIKVKSGSRTSFSENRRPTSSYGDFGHEASTRLAQALRDGSEVTFEFANAPAHQFTLKGSAAVMDRLGCDPNLL